MGRVIKAYLNERIDEPTFGELSGYVTDIYFPFPPGEEPRSRLTRALTAIGNLALMGDRFERRVSQIPDQSWGQPTKRPPLAPAGAWARGVPVRRLFGWDYSLAPGRHGPGWVSTGLDRLVG